MENLEIVSNLRDNSELTISNNKVTLSFKKYDVDTIIKLLTDLKFTISEDGYILYNEYNKYSDPCNNKELLVKDAIMCRIRMSDSPMAERSFPIDNTTESITFMLSLFKLSNVEKDD